ncbi:MAG TPA: hypothetical protein VG890_14950 [Puia sp.]|nr:hypothetical protein [Puia sp.]
MGVDLTIARFFVDRPVPADNSFWRDRLLYIGFGNGYVSIPVYYDLIFRIGVSRELILDEQHVTLMERLMHFAILQERSLISAGEELKSIQSLLNGRVKDEQRFNALNKYLDQPVLKPMDDFGLNYPSLNRADVYLYVLCDLPLTEEQWKLAIRYWYALHPTYLILDDLRDYEKDKTAGEENILLELGEDGQRVERALDLIESNCVMLEEVNPLLADFFRSYEEVISRRSTEDKRAGAI